MQKEYYYYYRSNKLTKDGKTENHPRITVCILGENYTYSRGISICSLKDNIDKVKGKKIAKNRAIKALDTKTTSQPIARSEAVIIRQHSNCAFTYKSSFVPPLTDHEIRIIHGKKKINL